MSNPQETTQQIFSLNSTRDRNRSRKGLFRPLVRLAESISRLRELPARYDEVSRLSAGRDFATHALKHLRISYTSSRHQFEERIPAQGPVVVIANHPFGGLEGLILLSLLGRFRGDVKILANEILQRIPELHDKMIGVDLFSGKKSTHKNMRALLEARAHLNARGLLVIFPAGEVSHFRLSTGQVADPDWFNTLNWLVKKTAADVLPIYFDGRNSLAFQVVGLIHPWLRTVMLPRELLNKQDKTIHLEVSQLITNRRLAQIGSDRELLDYLRFRTYLLKERISKKTVRQEMYRGEPIAPETPAARLSDDIGGLPEDRLLISSGHLSVYYGGAGELPNILPEIGRLREITFRNVQEGTGKDRDLDRYDRHYQHLFIWDNQDRLIVGAYRMGNVQSIHAAQGGNGLYTGSLFSFKEEFFSAIGPAMEMGRSFIRPEYQKSFGPLLLLWKGIGSYLVLHPEHRILYGPVSISRSYSDFSRRLIADALQKNLLHRDMAHQVRPKRGLRSGRMRIRGCKDAVVSAFTSNINEVAQLIGEVDTNEKDIPVLLKFYLSLGCKLLALNKDPLFGDVIDGLVLVDLLNTEEKTLRRYMGEEGARSYLAYHREKEFARAV